MAVEIGRTPRAVLAATLARTAMRESGEDGSKAVTALCAAVAVVCAVKGLAGGTDELRQAIKDFGRIAKARGE